MQEKLFYSLTITSNISTADSLSRLINDAQSRDKIERAIANVLRQVLGHSLGKRPETKVSLEVEISSLKDTHGAIGPPL
jgi:hypothetical protein